MEGQGIQLPLECNASEEFSIHYLHLFAIDRDNRIARHETFTSSHIHDNTLHATLPLGRYRLALVANAPEETLLSRKPEKHLKTCSSACHMKRTRTKKANDISTALQSVSITESKNTLPPIRLFRRTGVVLFSLHAIPEAISNLKLELSFVPSSVSFSGSTTNTFGTITKPVDHQGKAMIRTFPTKKEKPRFLLPMMKTTNQKKKSFLSREAIDTNQIIHVDCNFPN